MGVGPAGFHLRVENFQSGSARNDRYTPIGEYNEPAFYADRAAGWGMKAVGALKRGVSLQVARQDMDRVSHALPVEESGIRDRSIFKIGKFLLQDDNAFRIRVRQGIDQNAIHNREDGAVRANSQSDCKDRDKRKGGRFHKLAKCILKVVQHMRFTLSM